MSYTSYVSLYIPCANEEIARPLCEIILNTEHKNCYEKHDDKVKTLQFCNCVSDIPCNFQYGMCGWQSFRNMTINGINMTTTWAATKDYFYYRNYYGYHRYMPDNSFNSKEGKCLQTKTYDAGILPCMGQNPFLEHRLK